MANERARGLGYKYITDDKYLVNPFSPTEGISYEGDGSPVSYANSMGGIMSQAPAPFSGYIPRDGGGDGPPGPADPGSYDSAFDPETQNEEFNEDIGVGTVAEEDDEKSFGISKSRAAAYGLGMMFDPITTMLAARRYQNKQKQEEIDKINEKINKQYGYNTQSNDGSGLNDGPDGGYTGSGNEGVSKSDPTHSDNYDMKNGGRAGYFFGGRVNYKAGGRINFRGGGMDMGNEANQAQSAAMGNNTSAPGPGDTGGEGGNNPSDDSDKQFGGNNNDGNDNGPKNRFFNDPKTLYKYTNFGYNIPTGLTTKTPFGRLSAIINLNKTIEDEDLEGKVQLDRYVGPIDTRTAYDTTIGPTFDASYTRGPVNIGYNNLDGINASYNKGNFSIGYNNGQATFGYNKALANGGRVSFKNGGLASIL